MMSRNVKIGIVQSKCLPNKEDNLQEAIKRIEYLAKKGAQIICLQELFESEYFCFEENTTYFDLADAIPGKTTSTLSEVARQYNIVIVSSQFEKRAAGLYHNTAAVIDADGSYLGKYRKMHIPDDPGYYEKFYFTPGDLGYQVFDTHYGKIGILICWDQWFPEAARITSLKGAEILFYPTAIGWDLDAPQDVRIEEYQGWQTIQLSHAIANGVHVVAVNRVGTENNQLEFWGGSFVSNPFGSILHQSPHGHEDLAIVEVDLNETEKYRRTWPYLRDRRTDSYQGINHKYLDE